MTSLVIVIVVVVVAVDRVLVIIYFDVLAVGGGVGREDGYETDASDSMRLKPQRNSNAHMLTMPTHTADDSCYRTILSASD